jgi:ankyrin repeat protein
VLCAAGFGWCLSTLAQVPPTATEYAQYTGIFAAAVRNDSTKIAELIAAGEYAGIRDGHGRTPLHVAAYRKRHDAMRVLAAATGDPNVLDNDGYDIATIAAVANDADTLRVALAIGCSPANIIGPDNSTALIAAAQRGNDLAVRVLVGGDAQLDYVNNAGNTALTAAIATGDGSKRYIATVKLLAGANVNIADRSGATPLGLARARGYQEIIAILQQPRAKRTS